MLGAKLYEPIAESYQEMLLQYYSFITLPTFET